MEGHSISQRQSNSLSQSHKLILTQSITQSLAILCMGNQTLQKHVSDELEQNPMLESNSPDGSPDHQLSVQDLPEHDFRQDESGWKEGGDQGYYSKDVSSSIDMDGIDVESTYETSMDEKLHEQLLKQPMSSRDRSIAAVILDSLDDNGYLSCELSSITGGFPESELQIILESVIQELEPAGIGARDLSECLLLQMQGVDESSLLARRILVHNPDILIESDGFIIQKMGCRSDVLIGARLLLKSLDPFPGLELRGSDPIYIEPDVIFTLDDHDIKVDVPKNGWRNLSITKEWDDVSWKKGGEGDFMSTAKLKASQLMKALEHRGETITRVAVELATRQKAYFIHGPLALKPLSLADLALALGVHESTISRATTDKYIESPMGIVEIKSLFVAGLPRRGGGLVSCHQVQRRIKALVDSENRSNPLSDSAIEQRLQQEGIEIKRRTVSKYRSEIGLGTRGDRKKSYNKEGRCTK